jgi:hypothetical protein
MATWTSASDVTAGDRLLNVSRATRQLSDGAQVFLEYDPGAAAPNQVSLMLAADHISTPVFVASISSNNFDVPGLPQALDLVVDGSDNLYVIGQDSSSSDNLGVQAFTKGSGHTWSAQPYLNPGPSQTEGQNLGGFAALWCNTGGGTGQAGHLIVICDDAAGNDYVVIIDAGKALAGTQSSLVTKCTINPPFLGGAGYAASSGSNLALSADGFGATSGVAASATTATSFWLGAWGVTSSGTFTGGGGLSHSLTCGTLSLTTKIQLIRQSSNLWAAIYRSTGTPAQLSVQTCSSSALLGLLSAIGTTSNFPAQGASLAWAAAAGPTTPTSTILILGWSTLASHLDDLLQMTINLSTPTAPAVGAVTTINAAVSGGGASADMSTLRMVTQPVDPLHVDWQAYKSTSTYGLLGYYTAAPQPPGLPLLTSPTGGVVPLVAGNLVLDWTFVLGQPSDAQTGAYVRRDSAAGFQWWTGAAWTAAQAGATGGAEVAVTGLTTVSQVTTSTWTAAGIYSYSVQTIGATGLLSGYASAITFQIANIAPSTPTLTAVYNAATNQTTVTLTGSAGGPTGDVWFSDNGGATWTLMRGAAALTCYPTPAVLIDPEQPSGVTRQYQAQVWTGAPVSYSAFAAASVTGQVSAFWLIDPLGLVPAVNVYIKRGTYKTTVRKQQTEHFPLGSPFSLVAFGGLTGRQFDMTLLTTSVATETALEALLSLTRTILLQSPEPLQVYVNNMTDVGTDLPVIETAHASFREHAVTFVEAARP